MNPIRGEELPPLENPDVLEKVFGYCNFEDLKACRQVSKVWRGSSLQAWRSSVRVVIQTRGMKSMSEFLRFVQNKNSNHLECPFTTNYEVQENSHEFWHICGSLIKTLRIWRVQFQSVDDLRSVIFESCPNLEHLILSLNLDTMRDHPSVTEEPTDFTDPQFGENNKLKSLTMDGYDGRYPFSWMELHSHFPSLETLRLDGPIPNSYELFRSLTMSLIRENDPRKLKLDYIHAAMDGGWIKSPSSVFQFLLNSRLGLVSLELRGIGSGHVMELQKVLEIHAFSLKALTLTGEDDVDLADCFLSLSLGQLVNLQELKLLESSDWPWLTMGFLKFTPNLRTLAMTYCGNIMKGLDVWEMAGVNLLQCKELKISNYSVTEDQFAEDLRIVAKWIPNLETLNIGDLGNEGFRVVCEHWPNLVSLTVHRSSVDDCGITGLDAEDVARINEGGLTGTWRPIAVPRANITALKSLQTIHVTAWWFTGPDLGACSALCGILQLRQLRNWTFERNVNGGFKRQTSDLWNAVRYRIADSDDDWD